MKNIDNRINFRIFSLIHFNVHTLLLRNIRCFPDLILLSYYCLNEFLTLPGFYFNMAGNFKKTKKNEKANFILFPGQ